MRDAHITQALLKRRLAYDRKTGHFTWRINIGKMRAGDPAGCSNHHGYWIIGVCGVRYAAHRLAWLYVKGTFPKGDIDHRDGDGFNNKFSNLRDVSITVNAQNISSASKNNRSTGLLGAYPNPRGLGFVSFIRFGGRKRRLGLFKTALAAHGAYMAAKAKYHPGFIPARFL